VTNVSISDLKTSPAKVIAASKDYPVAIQKRGKTQAYVVGKDLFEKIITFVEDYIDRKALEETDFGKGRDFEEVAAELGI